MTTHNPNGEGSVRNWQHLTGRQFQQLDKRHTVVTVTCSPLEVHGPHLPVITDNLEAEGLTTRAIELLRERHAEIRFLRLPPIYVAADVVPHTGSLMFRNSTIVRVLSDLGRSLARQGFQHIWVASFHGGPRHFVAIEQACHTTNARYGARMVSLFSLLAKRLTNGTSNLTDVLGRIHGLTPQDLAGDVHGGVIETSLMLHLLGEHVDPCFKECPPMTAELKRVREGKPAPRTSGALSFLDRMRGFAAALKYYESETYAGRPALGSAEIGKAILDALAAECADTLSQLWSGQISPADCHSPVWPYKRIFLSRPISKVFEWAVGYKNPIF